MAAPRWTTSHATEAAIAVQLAAVTATLATVSAQVAALTVKIDALTVIVTQSLPQPLPTTP